VTQVTADFAGHWGHLYDPNCPIPSPTAMHMPRNRVCPNPRPRP